MLLFWPQVWTYEVPEVGVICVTINITVHINWGFLHTPDLYWVSCITGPPDMTKDCHKNLFSYQSKRPQVRTYKTTIRIITLKFNVQHSALHKRNGNVWNDYSLIFVQRTYTTVFKRSRDSVLSIVIRLQDEQSGVRIPAGTNISLNQNVHIGSETHTAVTGIGGAFPG
jgi:hypothetical protein